MGVQGVGHRSSIRGAYECDIAYLYSPESRSHLLQKKTSPQIVRHPHLRGAVPGANLSIVTQLRSLAASAEKERARLGTLLEVPGVEKRALSYWSGACRSVSDCSRALHCLRQPVTDHEPWRVDWKNGIGNLAATPRHAKHGTTSKCNACELYGQSAETSIFMIEAAGNPAPQFPWLQQRQQ